MSKYEDYKRAIKNIDDLLQAINSNDDMVKYHYYVKAVDMSRLNQLVEKEKPKKPIYYTEIIDYDNYDISNSCEVDFCMCDNCKENIIDPCEEWNFEGVARCPHCGQKLDWSE